MLAIRIQRKGRTHTPIYRLVVQESQRHPLSGRIVAEVGNYNPDTKKLTLDKASVEKYLKNGAQPSSRVAHILEKNGVQLPAWYHKPTTKKAAPKHVDKLRKNQPKEEPSSPETSAETTTSANSDASDVSTESTDA